MGVGGVAGLGDEKMNGKDTTVRDATFKQRLNGEGKPDILKSACRRTVAVDAESDTLDVTTRARMVEVEEMSARHSRQCAAVML